MNLEIIDQVTVPVSRLGAVEKFQLLHGQGLKMKQTGPAVDILDADVPAHKKWEVTISITVIETDA